MMFNFNFSHLLNLLAWTFFRFTKLCSVKEKTKSNSYNMEKIAVSLLNNNYLSKYPWFMVSNSSLVTSILKSMSSITFSTWAKIWLLALSTFLTRPASLNNFAIALGFFRTSKSKNEMSKYSLIFEKERDIECQYKYIQQILTSVVQSKWFYLTKSLDVIQGLINNEFVTENSLQITFNIW